MNIFTITFLFAFVGGFFCVGRGDDTQCVVSVYIFAMFNLLPDWLAIPVALDRLNAVQHPIWYKENCTKKLVH